MKQNKATILLVLLVLSAITVSAGFFLGVETPTYVFGNSIASVMGVDVSGGGGGCAYIYNCPTLNSSIIAYYSANTNGSYPDETGTYNGTINGATYTSDGIIGGAYTSDGSSDYINTNYQPSAFNTGTIMLWYKGDEDFTGNTALIGSLKENGAVDPILKMYGWALDQKPGFQYRDTSGNLKSFRASTAIDDNLWHHIAMTWTSGEQKIYVDGSLENTETGTIGTMDISSTPLFISATNLRGSAAEYSNGTIDEVGIFGEVYNLTQIGLVYNSGAGLPFD